jgi:UDPglucose 6-dehydrogenase
MTRVGVVGPSHLGVVWSAVLAEKGHKVTYLKSTRFEVYEPQLKDLIEKNINNGNLEYNNQYSMLEDCDIVYLGWDTPTDIYNNIQLDLLQRVIDAIIPHLHDKAILVIQSQVPPGFCRTINFDKERLAHQVDTLIYGKSIERALNPDLMIIGTNDGTYPATEEFMNYYGLVNSFSVKCFQLNFEEAEIFKLAMNANLAAQIAVTNTMAELCTTMGANWDWVAECLAYDKRIGSYTRSGLGIGGGHMTRDLATIEALSRKNGFNADIITSAIYSSKHMHYWALRQLKKWFGPNPEDLEIAIWGLSYKPNTDSIKDSPAIITINELPACKFLAHDPQVNYTKTKFIVTVDDPLDAIDEHTSALLIMTEHDEYKKISAAEIKGRMPNALILDPYKVLPDTLDRITL